MEVLIPFSGKSFIKTAMISGQDMGVKTICLMRVSVQPIQRTGSWKVMTGSWKEASTHKIVILINIDNRYSKVTYMINEIVGFEKKI